MIGHRFSIVSTSNTSVPNHEVLARKYHMDGLLAPVRDPIKKVSAEIVNHKIILMLLGVPVLDGIVCGLIFMISMVKAGISTSKIGRYRPQHPENG